MKISNEHQDILKSLDEHLKNVYPSHPQWEQWNRRMSDFMINAQNPYAPCETWPPGGGDGKSRQAKGHPVEMGLERMADDYVKNLNRFQNEIS